MSVLFPARQGFTEAPVLSVAADRRRLRVRVPSDAVSGFVRLIGFG